MTRIRSTESINLDATTRVEVADTSLRLGNLTTTQRDALTAANGDMVYNTTTNEFNIRAGGAWTTLATVEGLVDSAPTTLDTLNELAAALGDDPNFATTVTNSIATKLPLAGGTMTGDIDGNGNKVLFANVYSQLSDLPSASTYHGMFAHVHATGKGYYAHAGAWIEMANQSDLTTTNTNVTNLTNSLSTTNTNVTNLTNSLNTTNTNLTSVDNGKLNLSGGTMTGTLTLNGAPSSANHAATKAYVDSAIAGSGGGGSAYLGNNDLAAGNYVAWRPNAPNNSWYVYKNSDNNDRIANGGNFSNFLTFTVPAGGYTGVGSGDFGTSSRMIFKLG